MSFVPSAERLTVQSEEEPRRRLSLFRRTGGVVMSETLIPVGTQAENFSDNEIDLFGIEENLIEYQNRWAEHSSVVSEFINNAENRDLMKNMLTEATKSPSDRTERRTVAKYQERDFDLLTAIYVTAGKIPASLISKAGVGMSSLSDGIASAVDSVSQRRRIEAKRTGLMHSMPDNRHAQELSKRLVKLESDSRKTYKPIVKEERKMTESVARSVGDDPMAAVRLIESFIDCTDTEADLEKSFAAFLASDYVMSGEGALLNQALRMAEKAAKEGELANKFIQKQVEENGGDNMLAFFAKALAATQVPEPLTDFMARNQKYWPSELRSAYVSYSENFIRSASIKVRNGAMRSMKKLWLHPDMLSYEQAIDRLAKNVGVRWENQTRAPKKRSVPRMVGSPMDSIKINSPEEEHAPLAPAILKGSKGSLVVEEADSLDGVLDKLLSNEQQKDRKLVSELRTVLAALQENPFGRKGVHSLKDIHVDVNGQRKKVYSCKPQNITGISVSRRTELSRIMYTVYGDRLAVYSIPVNHDDYEQKIKNL